MDLPQRSGVPLPGGADVLDAPTADLLAWLRTKGVAEPRLRDAEQLDKTLQGFRRTVLRYGLVRAAIEKGHEVPRDAEAWAAFDAAMRAHLEPSRA